MIQAWALEQEIDSKRKFNDQNVLVPWKLQSKFATGYLGTREEESEKMAADAPAHQQLVFQRFCHVYCEGELEDLVGR